MNPLYPTRMNNHHWIVPNVNRYNRNALLPMNYGDYHTINTNAAWNHFKNLKKNGNMEAVQPVLELSKKNNNHDNNNLRENIIVNNNNNNHVQLEGSIKKQTKNKTTTKNKLFPVIEQDVKEEQDGFDGAYHYSYSMNKQIAINNNPQPCTAVPSSIAAEQINVQPTSSIINQTEQFPSAIYYLFFFITSIDALDNNNNNNNNKRMGENETLSIVFEIPIDENQLLQMESLQRLLLSSAASSSQSPLHPNNNNNNNNNNNVNVDYYYHPEFRMFDMEDEWLLNDEEFQMGVNNNGGRWEISVGDG